MLHLNKAYIGKNALRHNLAIIYQTCGNTPICAMVKANAYGHGIKEVFSALKDLNIAFWGVASPEEAIELIQLGATKPILLLRPVSPITSIKQFKQELKTLNIPQVRLTIASAEGLNFLEDAIHSHFKHKIKIHIKVDTGMGRNGCRIEELEEILGKIFLNPQLELEGIYSHFATSDEGSLAFAKKQLRRFRELVMNLKRKKVYVPLYHIANSGAIFNLPSSRFDMVRPGIALYGYANKNVEGSYKLTPAMKVESVVILTKWLKRGESCGYGRTFVAKRQTRIALLPIGYADGLDRRLSNNGFVNFSDNRIAKIAGRISMDLTAVDITDLPDVNTGSSVTIISNNRSMPNSVEAIAERLGTIPYEVTCSIGKRIKRILLD